jgi:DNA-binding Lrp family transcriptional regulator
MLKDVYGHFPGKLHNNVTSVSISNFHHPRGYLINEKTQTQISYGGEPAKVKIDEVDKKIIRMINQDARLTNSEIGLELGLNYKTIQARIRRMEGTGIIRAYRTWIDFSKIGYTYYKSLVKLRKLTTRDERKILTFCRQNPNVIYLLTCAWPWDMEIEVECRSEREFLDIMRSFRELMSDLNISSITILFNWDWIISNYGPFHTDTRGVREPERELVPMVKAETAQDEAPCSHADISHARGTEP